MTSLPKFKPLIPKLKPLNSQNPSRPLSVHHLHTTKDTAMKNQCAAVVVGRWDGGGVCGTLDGATSRLYLAHYFDVWSHPSCTLFLLDYEDKALVAKNAKLSVQDMAKVLNAEIEAVKEKLEKITEASKLIWLMDELDGKPLEEASGENELDGDEITEQTAPSHKIVPV
ncbi:unnamed protein product [Fraxinus pennsylvanica]|uniref:Uncharacterized protein n=1 Tax=Fraxinus pennsylvanica TaxID=56036 RepID=A0AAD1Z1N5_9LAMI|nr:unnamed protein product [Fraxinus pennsylvanica]